MLKKHALFFAAAFCFVQLAAAGLCDVPYRGWDEPPGDWAMKEDRCVSHQVQAQRMRACKMQRGDEWEL